MPHTLARRSERRAFSRDGARQFAQPNPSSGPNRKARRKQGERHGDVSLLVHGPHDRAFLYSGTVNGGGQARINHKRQQRAFWRTVRIRVSAEVEPYFRESLHLLGDGTRVCGRTPVEWGLWVELDVRIPGAPADAVTATPVYYSECVDPDLGRYEPRLSHIEWHRADGSRIETAASGVAP
jgi:hypothetical protein